MVRVTFEFDVTGNDSCEDILDPACRENLIDIFRGILHRKLEDKSDTIFRETDAAIKDALIATYDQDIELCHRILNTIKIEQV